MVTDKPVFLFDGSVVPLFEYDIPVAETLAKFWPLNKAIRYFNKHMNLKSIWKDGFRFIKKFDLSQIKDHNTYPKEWGLTQADIEKIENEIK